MGKFLILLLLLGCQEPDKLNDMSLVVSDASEIQLWATGQSSFNEESQGYTDDYCFHQKFLCTSERKFQGYEVNAVNDYYLIATDEDGNELFNEIFIKSSNLFLQALSDGVNDPIGAGTNWTLGAIPTISVTGALASSKLFYLKLYATEASTDYSFDYDFTRVFSGTGQVNIYVVDQAYFDTGLGSPLGSLAVVDDIGTFDYTGVAGVPAYIGIEVFNTSGTSDVDINSFDLVGQSTTQVVTHSLALTPSSESMCDKKVQFKIYDGPDSETDNEIYHSDFVDFVSVWENGPGSGRVQIQFKSVQNFADLIYNSTSGYFNLELEGRFRKERKVTAQKSIELTETVLNTAASVKKQRKLTLDDLPDYMHTKVQLILAHAPSGSVIVNTMGVSVEESYDEGDRPETYPMQPAEVWLTQKEYYKHNVN